MNNDCWPITDLLIVGYADRVIPETVPSVVTPIYRSLSDPKLYFLPSFHEEGDQLCGALQCDRTEFDRLILMTLATEFKRAFPAQPGYMLWINEHMRSQYGPRNEVLSLLEQKSKYWLEYAKTSFEKRDFKEAENLAQRAFTADEDNWDALALIAAASEMQGETEGWNILIGIAEDIRQGSGDDFRGKVAEMVNRANRMRERNHVKFEKLAATKLGPSRFSLIAA